MGWSDDPRSDRFVELEVRDLQRRDQVVDEALTRAGWTGAAGLSKAIDGELVYDAQGRPMNADALVKPFVDKHPELFSGRAPAPAGDMDARIRAAAGHGVVATRAPERDVTGRFAATGGRLGSADGGARLGRQVGPTSSEAMDDQIRRAVGRA